MKVKGEGALLTQWLLGMRRTGKSGNEKKNIKKGFEEKNSKWRIKKEIA